MDRPQPACDGSEPYVFVTYAHADAELVYPEIRWLQDHGFPVWWDEGISPGAAWREELARSIRGCSLLLYFVTPNSVASEQCIREVSFGLDEHSRPVLPVHLEETRLPDALSLSLSHRQAILRHTLTPEDYERKLLATVASHLEVPVPAPARPLPSPARAAASGRRRAWVFGTAAALLAAAIGYGLGARIDGGTEEGAGAPTVRSTVELHPDAPLVIGGPAPLIGFHSTSLALSPDGRYLAYVGATADGAQRLYLRDLSRYGFEPVAGTDGAIFPFFSPDSEWLGFLTNDKIKRVPVAGGSAVTIANARAPIFAAWLSDDRIRVGDRQGLTLSVMSPDGEDRESLLAAEDVVSDAWMTDVLPGGRYFLRTDRGDGLLKADIMLYDSETGESTRLLDRGYGARYLPGGRLLFGRGGNLYAVSFSTSSLTIEGEPELVAENVAMDTLFGQVQATVSLSGSIAYAAGGDAGQALLQWVDRAGGTETLPLEPGLYNFFDLDADDERLAIHVGDVQDYILLYDVGARAGRRLPLDASAGWPTWSPAGDRLLLSTRRNDEWVLGVHPVNGVGGFVEHDRHVAGWATFSFWSNTDVWFYQIWPGGIGARPGPERTAMPLVDEVNAWGAEASPDGRWIAYISYRTGRAEIRLRSFPEDDVDRQITTDGGIEPVWCRACDELFYRNGNRWYAVEIETEPALRIGTPEPVFEVPGFVDTGGRSYDVSSDGQRLLVLRRVNDPVTTRVRLLQNAF